MRQALFVVAATSMSLAGSIASAPGMVVQLLLVVPVMGMLLYKLRTP